MNSSFWKFLALTALVLVATGCGEGGPRTYKAGGTVTYNDKPLDQASVTFLYEDGSFASGVTDATGKFYLVYTGRKAGTILGKCKVTVTKLASSGIAAPGPGAKPEDMMKAMQAAAAASMKEGAGKTGPKSLIPEKFASPDASGLAFEVKADEKENVFPIALKD